MIFSSTALCRGRKRVEKTWQKGDAKQSGESLNFIGFLAATDDPEVTGFPIKCGGTVA